MGFPTSAAPVMFRSQATAHPLEEARVVFSFLW
jgi:hypothetical protein